MRGSTCVPPLSLARWSVMALKDHVNALNTSEECAEALIGEITSYEVCRVSSFSQLLSY